MEFKEAWPFVVSAYMGIWVVLFAYVIIMQSKVSKVKRELGTLSKAFENKNQ